MIHIVRKSDYSRFPQITRILRDFRYEHESPVGLTNNQSSNKMKVWMDHSSMSKIGEWASNYHDDLTRLQTRTQFPSDKLITTVFLKHNRLVDDRLR